MRKKFKEVVLRIAGRDPKAVLILADISVYLFNEFKEKYPQRFFNMGICENALVSVAAGLSSQGYHPFLHSIAPFVTEKSYEQIKLDMCYNKFGGNILTCGASFDYAWDGPSHYCYTDLAILRLLPGMEVIQPGSVAELEALLESQYNNGNPTYFRLSDYPHTIDIGKVVFGRAHVLKNQNAEVTVMTAGPLLGNVLEACKDLKVNLVYFHTIKPIDKDVIRHFQDTRIVVIHDAFGLYEAVNELPGLSTRYHGLPDGFCAHYGTHVDMRRSLGLDVFGIRACIQDYVGKGEKKS